MTEKRENKFRDFTPYKAWIGWNSLRCPEDGNMMIAIASNRSIREQYLSCREGGCGHHTIIDDWTLMELDVLWLNPGHRYQTYRIGGETTRSIEKYLTWIEGTFGVTIDKELRKHIHASRPYLKIYVAGPYSSPDRDKVIHNVFAAIDAGIQIIRKGHIAYVPHAMTYMMDNREKALNLNITYDEWTELDDTFLTDWCDALLLLSNSPSAVHELEKAKALGKKIFRSVEEIPFVD
jgi:hypothetical protein